MGNHEKRPDVGFYLLTKRPERVAEHLPKNWKNGWDNIFFSVTAENQIRADERLPILLDLPFKHKGVMTAPFIGKISLKHYLSTGKIEQVVAGGKNYDGSRMLKYDWVKQLYDECVSENVTFCFIETGTIFEKNGKIYNIPNKRQQSELAYKTGLQYQEKITQLKLSPIQHELFNNIDWYEKKWNKNCNSCGSKLICNGCTFCGLCK